MADIENLKTRGHQDKWILILAVVAALIALGPSMMQATSGLVPIANPWATDDQMVYAAWIRQAQDFRILMDNRFAIEDQPALTINFYFFVLGLISKVTGIFWASELVKALLAFLVVLKIHAFASRITAEPSTQRLATVLTVFGGGLGFLVWHQFGEAIVRPAPPAISSFALGRLPIDVWQPEAFVLPSMLVNGLFLAALWLILHIFGCLLDAEMSSKGVLGGAVATALLANIHSYDLVIVGAVGILFCGAMAVQRRLTKAWFMRGAALYAGAIPSAIWLAYVLKQDPVFQSRAATETFSPNLRLVLLGMGFLLVLGYAGLWHMRKEDDKKSGMGLGLAASSLGVMALLAANHVHSYFMTWPLFLLAMALTAVSVGLFTGKDNAASLIGSWCLTGPVILYIPTLFQRKLAMGLAIPFAILSAVALAAFANRQTPTIRRAVLSAAVGLTCIGSLLWLTRHVGYVTQDVSRTTVHPLSLAKEDMELLQEFEASLVGKRILAMPGVPLMETDEAGNPVPDRYVRPYLPDLNPLLSGYFGAYTFAGHWSESPNYNAKRSQAASFFDASTQPAVKKRFLSEFGIDMILAPKPSAFPQLELGGLIDVKWTGKVLGESERFALIEVDKTAVN